MWVTVLFFFVYGHNVTGDTWFVL